MGQMNMTVQVLNLAPTVTRSELIVFFSYCGTVDSIHIQKNKDQSQSALVTFTQPYAFQTALLLDDAVVAGQPIRVLSSHDRAIFPSGPDKLTDTTQKVIVDRTRTAMGIAEQTAGRIGAKIKNSTDYVSSGAVWLSGVLDKASKFVADLGTNKKDDPNSRKQK